jgi:hypothetical protein
MMNWRMWKEAVVVHPAICLEQRRKTMKNSVRIAGLQVGI